MMARLKRPFASAHKVSNRVSKAPADWPDSVTLAASPPNALIFAATQRNAASTSRTVLFEGASGAYRLPQMPSR